MATLQLVCTTMSICDPYRELELYLEQANSDISEVFNKWAKEGCRRFSDLCSVETGTNDDNSVTADSSYLPHSPSTETIQLSLVSSSTLTALSSRYDASNEHIYKRSFLPTSTSRSLVIDHSLNHELETPSNTIDKAEEESCNGSQQSEVSTESWPTFPSLLDDPDLEPYTNPLSPLWSKESLEALQDECLVVPFRNSDGFCTYQTCPITAEALQVICKNDHDHKVRIRTGVQQMVATRMAGEHFIPLAHAVESDPYSPNTDILSMEAELALDTAIAEGDVAGGYAHEQSLEHLTTLEMLVDIVERMVPLPESDKVNKQQLEAVLKLRTNLWRYIIFDIEATEACRWLRAAGFPQYAQLYENNQFPVEVSSVEQDHPQLEASVLASLFRRLHVLNRCARLHQQKTAQQQSDWDDEECALSANWTYQSDVRRWSRVGRDLEIPDIGSNDWLKLNKAMHNAVGVENTGDSTVTNTSTLPASLSISPQRERDTNNQQQKILRAGSMKIRRRALNRDPFDSSPVSTSNSSNNSVAPNSPAASVLDMLSQQLRSLNTSQSNMSEMDQCESHAVSTISLAIGDSDGTLPRASRRSKALSLDKCDIPGMPSALPTEKTSRFGMDMVLAGLEASKSVFCRSTWQSQSRAAAADVLEERLELEEGGRPISTLSCIQLHVLRKLALLKLTAFMERFCPAHRTGWNWDLPKIMMRKSKSNSYKDQAIFGVPITITQQRTGYPMPKGIEMALDWLADNGKDQVGIFRRSGVKSRIQTLRVLMEESSNTVDFNSFQAYDTADMVKQYFRELPEALLTNKLSETFILIIQHVPLNLRRESFLCAILLMPDEHTEVLRMLLSFLRDLARYSEEHQMTISNLAVCFAPSLFHYQQVPQSRQGLGQPHAKELAESYAAHDCLSYLLENYDNVFSIPRELLYQCKGDEIKDSAVLHLNELGSDCNGNWRSYLQECQNALMREVREKNRGWLAVQSHHPRIELSYKKVADGHPLRLWKICAEVEAPPIEVLHRILRERHVWDEDLEGMRIVQIIDEDTEVLQYHRHNIKPLPVEDYCVIRMWKSDLHKGACVVVETSVEHDDATTVPNSVRSIVLASRYLIEPCGSGRSRVVHLVRVDTRGRMPDWFQKNYGHICSIFLTNLQNSFRKSASGPESKV